MKRAIIATILAAILILAAGCGAAGNPSQSVASVSSTTAEIAENSEAVENSGTVAENPEPAQFLTDVSASGRNVSYEYDSVDSDSGWDAGSATTIALKKDATDISGSGAVFSGGVLTIRQAGTYVLSGTLDNGQILIDAGKNDIVRLVLNGVALRNDTGPAIYAPQSEKVVLILADGTENEVADGAEYDVAGDKNEPDAAIFAQDSLSVTGNGTLTVAGNHNHGIRAQDILAVTGGTLNVTAVGDALRGRDGVAIKDGSLKLAAGGDGIQSNNAEADDRGFVIIGGGTLDINAANDGIQAESSLVISGGTMNLVTGGGSESTPENADESVSMKALKSGKLLSISGGDITIDASDDAVHSNGSVSIASGALSISSGDDGVHAEKELSISGGEITVLRSYEALEGSDIYITGGTMNLISDDDAINAAGGSSNGTDGMGGRFGRDVFAGGGDYTIDISGGSITSIAGGDGLDSNGTINISGGEIEAVINSTPDNTAIDSDGATTITGGVIFAGGTGTLGNLSGDSTTSYVYLTDVAPGEEIKVNSGRDLIVSYTPDMELGAIVIFTPSIVSGESYDVTAGGATNAVTAGTGGVGMGFGMGGRGGRGGWGGGQRPEGGAGGFMHPEGMAPREGSKE